MVSNVDLKGAKVKYPATLFQFSIAFQPAKRALNLTNEAGGDVQPVVAGQHPANVQAADFLHRFKELPGVGGGVKRVQTAQVGQVAGVQVFPLGLIKAAVARRVAGGVVE